MLFVQAVANLHALRTQGLTVGSFVQLIEADYCDISTYESHKLNFSQTCVMLNCSDGNQERLVRFVTNHGGERASFCLLAHDPSVHLDELELHSQHEVQVEGEANWLLSVCRRPME